MFNTLQLRVPCEYHEPTPPIAVAAFVFRLRGVHVLCTPAADTPGPTTAGGWGGTVDAGGATPAPTPADGDRDFEITPAPTVAGGGGGADGGGATPAPSEAGAGGGTVGEFACSYRVVFPIYRGY